MSGTDVLSAVWPNGIPTQDYARVLRVVKAMNGAASAHPLPTAAPPPKKVTRATGEYSAKASKAQVARVLAMLQTGPATAKELTEATKVPNPTVYGALRQCGAVVIGTMKVKRTDGKTSGRAPALWALPSTK